LRGLKPPFTKQLDLIDHISRVTVSEGKGTTAMIRQFGPSSPEPLSKDWFLAKIRHKAEEAYGQMKNSSHLRVLVINFDSPSGFLSGDFVSEARTAMSEAFKREVDPYLLLYRDTVLL